MARRVLLFDIDGTLVDGDGAGRRAMEAAFADVTGDAAVLRTFTFAGMTDPAIVRAGLRALAIDPARHPELIEAVLAGYLERLPPTIAATPKFRLHAGVAELLDAIAGNEALAIGLGTGNLERGAEHKLAPLGIWGRFAFGGYGSDAEDRAALLEVGARRGAARLGQPREHCRVIVIGDTPLDVAAAHAIGAECLAVATSVFDAPALRATGAELVVDDLGDAAALAMLVD
jgi:phosphoglycolate phosphatase-like HAD superfamily hydrolase